MTLDIIVSISYTVSICAFFCLCKIPLLFHHHCIWVLFCSPLSVPWLAAVSLTFWQSGRCLQHLHISFFLKQCLKLWILQSFQHPHCWRELRENKRQTTNVNWQLMLKELADKFFVVTTHHMCTNFYMGKAH